MRIELVYYSNLERLAYVNLQELPRIGDQLFIKSKFWRIKDVTHFFENDGKFRDIQIEVEEDKGEPAYVQFLKGE